jgi:hypothetical protein
MQRSTLFSGLLVFPWIAFAVLAYGSATSQKTAEGKDRQEFTCKISYTADGFPVAINDTCQKGDWLPVHTTAAAKYCDVSAKMIILPDGTLCQYLGYERVERREDAPGK